MPKDYVDFAGIKERVSMEAAVGFLGLKQLERSGDQCRYQCPMCKGNRDLSVNVGKQVFKCFSWGKGGTDSIALVAHVRGIRQRDAAVLLDQQFPAQQATSPAPKAETGGGAVPDIAEMLGISPAALSALGAEYDEQSKRFVIPLRGSGGVQVGSLGIATTIEQTPLLAFTFDDAGVTRCTTGPQSLRDLFRLVS
jgi:hypothetical protein